jgi:hypothetical protein
MADGKNKRGPADRNRINIHEPYEIEYWRKHFDVTAQQLRGCINQVGPMVADVQRHLGK